MPNRVIRSGFLDSEKINSLSSDSQLFFIRIMLIVDDFGKFDGRITMIKSFAYPISNIPIKSVSKFLSDVCNAGLIEKYEVAGKPYIRIKQFNQRLRVMKSKYPDPCQTDDRQMTDIRQTDDGLNPNPNPNPNPKRKEYNRSILRPCFILKWRIMKHKQQLITNKTILGWANQVEIMCKKENRTPKQIIDLINSCHDMEPNDSGFTWRNNILSMEKLREKWNDGKIYIQKVKNSHDW